MIELLAAMALLIVAALPLAYSVAQEKRLARAQYQHAVAMSLLDSEFEILLAGEWRSFPLGITQYPVRSSAVSNLPAASSFVLSLGTNSLRLEWVKDNHPVIRREATIR
jgi:hypothetical protein